MKLRSGVAIVLCTTWAAFATAGTGQPYLGEPLPGEVPMLFAPGVVSNGLYNRDVAVSPDGRELYFGSCVAGRCVILQTHVDDDGSWTSPEVASFSGAPGANELEPAFSPDGRRLYFLSTRPADGSEPDPDTRGWPNENIWFVERGESGWSAPQPVGPPVNSDASEFFPSLSANGTLYFTRNTEDSDPAIYRARPEADGGFAEPEKLQGGPNAAGGAYNAHVAPDESWIVTCLIPEGKPTPVYAVSFALDDGSWSDPIPLDGSLNAVAERAISVNVSPDGQHLFFAAMETDLPSENPRLAFTDLVRQLEEPRNGSSDIYWVASSVVDRLRPLAALGDGPYLDQPLPGAEPEVFAPGIVSTGLTARDVAMMPDGSEIYFSVVVGRHEHSAIAMVRQVDGRWSAPEIAPFSGNPQHQDLEPAIAPDGSRLLFFSDRPKDPGGEPSRDLWAVDRDGEGWSDPYNLGPPVNTDANEYFPSLTDDGTLYFTRSEVDNPEHRIYRARWADGAFTAPEQLPEQVNLGRNRFNAFVAPDESYLIVPALGRDDSLGGVDYYVIYRTQDDRWSEPVHLPAPINSAAQQEWSPYVAPDGSVLFFMSDRTPQAIQRLTADAMHRLHASPHNGNPAIYWVTADIIEQLRPVE